MALEAATTTPSLTPNTPINLDTTVAHLRALPTPVKLSLSGALAVLMGRRSHDWNLELVDGAGGARPFCAWLLEHIMIELLQLPAEQLEGLRPLTEPRAVASGAGAPSDDVHFADPAPFVQLLPVAAAEREVLLHGLLLLVATVTSGTGAACGYDARTRQLLQAAMRAPVWQYVLSRAVRTCVLACLLPTYLPIAAGRGGGAGGALAPAGVA